MGKAYRVWFGVGGSCVATAIVVACSGSVAPVGGGGDGGGRDSGGGADSGELVPGCPANAPGEGTACTTDRLDCEYGSDVSLDCNTLMECSSSKWHRLAAASFGPTHTCPTPPNPSACPASYGALPNGGFCAQSGLTCAYAGGSCSCEVYCGSQYPLGHACDAGTPTTWVCSGVTQGCPAERPRVGTACAQEGLSCGYDASCNGFLEQCQSGTWHAVGTGCPASSRKYKKDVVYLDDEARRAVAEHALRARLATYRYTSGDPATHLGVIIEDDPTSPAVGAGRERVDLYAYASTAIAAIQEQDREIQALRREIHDLRRKVDGARDSRACR